jgi:hypothetical protein
MNIDLRDANWATRAGVPSRAGWYFVRTNAPLDVLQQQRLWSETYEKKKNGQRTAVRNYNLAERAARWRPDLEAFWNITDVYSGYAGNLMARAREHTFPDPGTGGLALSRYPDLLAYEWQFFFVTLARFRAEVSCPDMLLRLGEQLWRAENGWPILCLN